MKKTILTGEFALNKKITRTVLWSLPVIPSPLMKLSQSSNSRPKWLYKSRVVTPRRPAERHRETVVLVSGHMGENDVAQTPSGPQTIWSHREARAGKKLILLGVWKGPLYQNTVVILEDAIIIILTLERNAKRMEAVTHLTWVGWEKCVGHKCLWTGDERLSWREMFLCWYQTPLHLLLNRWLIIKSYLVCPVKFVRCLWCHCIRAAGLCADPALVQQILCKYKNRVTQAKFNLTINNNETLYWKM